MIINPKIVVIGGGTGLSNLLKGLKEHTDNVTAIVTVADDGGGSGVLRTEMGMLPPGDIRNCILALANAEPVMERILGYRFTDGSLKGQSFGNLFLAALNGVYGSFYEAVRRMSDVLAITGRVLPVTTADVRLIAELSDGASVEGESKIKDFKLKHGCRIERVRLEPPSPDPLPDAVEAIADADMIVLGPGSLYTSIIPNLLVGGIADAVLAANALKVYVCNVMTQEGETESYTAYDHAEALIKHSRRGLFSRCLANSAAVPPDIVERYSREGATPPECEPEPFREAGVELIMRDVLSTGGDYARHDPRKLANALLSLMQ